MTTDGRPAQTGITAQMPDIEIFTNVILKLLANLAPTTAAGPYKMRALVLE